MAHCEDGYEAKVKEYEVIQHPLLGELPQIQISGSSEDNTSYALNCCKDVVEEIFKNQEDEKCGCEKIKYTRELYFALGVCLEDGRKIYIDGRYAPSKHVLQQKYKAKYNDDYFVVKSYFIEETDDKGQIVFSHAVDSIPDIVHNLDKFFGVEDDDEGLPF